MNFAAASRLFSKHGYLDKNRSLAVPERVGLFACAGGREGIIFEFVLSFAGSSFILRTQPPQAHTART